MSRFALDLTGQKYGRYTVISRMGLNKAGNATWLCECECGVRKVVAAGALRSGVTRSCGCWIREVTSRRSLSHGQTKTRLHRIWTGMKTRCINSNATNFLDYGGRGIKVCDEWASDFVVFRDWALANGYTDQLTIDRINNNGSYNPENCRWVSSFKQQGNKRSNRRIVIDGISKTVSEWAREYDIDPQAIWARLNRGWDGTAAVLTPSDASRKRKKVAAL